MFIFGYILYLCWLGFGLPKGSLHLSVGMVHAKIHGFIRTLLREMPVVNQLLLNL